MLRSSKLAIREPRTEQTQSRPSGLPPEARIDTSQSGNGPCLRVHLADSSAGEKQDNAASVLHSDRP